MRKLFRRGRLGLAMAAVILCVMSAGCGSVADKEPISRVDSHGDKRNELVRAVDSLGDQYDQYSNEKKEWYFVRNDTHEVSGAQEEIDLSVYNAIYLGNSSAEKPTIYLTFDCGYENGYTEAMLDVLKEYDVKAIFFVTGHYVESAPELVKRMKEDGHLVGNHTLNHKSIPSISTKEFVEEVTGLEELMEEKTGYQLDLYFRPPKGEYSERTLKVVSDLGYKTVFWSLAYYDYDVNQQPGKEHVIEHFEKYYHPGAVPLMHTVSASNAEALEEIIKNLQAKGYVFGTFE